MAPNVDCLVALLTCDRPSRFNLIFVDYKVRNMAINREDRFECEVEFTSLSEYGPLTWLVRPCEWYLQEYKDCKSIRGRVHQYFISGKFDSCDTNRDDYFNCSNFRKTKNPDYLNRVINSELAKKEARFAQTKANTIWEYRSSPPEDWSKPIANENCNDS